MQLTEAKSGAIIYVLLNTTGAEKWQQNQQVKLV